jgi:hypothetical protein
LVAAAARNGTGIMGIAYEATIIGLRADSPGSCAGTGGCTFGDTAIAAGIDRAVTNGAKVINLSFGGGSAGSQVQAAVGRAASGGVVVVVSAGNEGDSATPTSDPNNPDPFAASLRAAGNGNGNVIIAGSVNGAGTISSFSNRAGNEANWYLGALGENICCTYENGTIKTTTQNGQQYVTVWNGTSFSAPQISGAAALLRQAFPKLTAAQVVNLLLTTARDAGAAGVDATYGRGILDITNAFAPKGATSLAGTNTALPLTSTSVITSAAMGDALSHGQLKTVVLDSYARAYTIDLAANGSAVAPVLKLIGSLSSPLRQVTTGTDRLALAFSVDAARQIAGLPWKQQLRLSTDDATSAKVRAARIIGRMSPKTSFGFAYAQGTDGLAAQLRGRDQPAFLIAGDPLDDVGFGRRDLSAWALHQSIGPWALTVTAEHGGAIPGARVPGDLLERRENRDTAARYGVALDRNFGRLETSLGMSRLAENHTILGARLLDALGNGGSHSVFVDANLGWRLSDAWRIGAAWRQGSTTTRLGGTLTTPSRLVSNSWAFDASRYGVFGARDSLSFRLSQPLRVASGGLNFLLPVAYSYDTLTATREVRTLSLAPGGREVAGEIGWRGPLGPGWGAERCSTAKTRAHVQPVRRQGLGI